VTTPSEFAQIVSPLAFAMGRDLDEPTWAVYYATLKDLPPAMLRLAVAEASKTSRFMPRPAELRELVDRVEQALQQAFPYCGCAECGDQKGWLTLEKPDGRRYVQRCGCFDEYRKHLQDFAARCPAVALLPLAIVGEPEPLRTPSETRERR
jgi:hypothetical protein